jgi:hypothetical protein
VGATLFRAAEGLPLYQRPFLFDEAFVMLLPRPAAGAAAEPSFGGWLRRRHGHVAGGAGGPGVSAGAGAGAGHRRLSRELVELIVLLLRVSPFERPLSAAEVLRHRWFSAAGE